MNDTANGFPDGHQETLAEELARTPHGDEPTQVIDEPTQVIDEPTQVMEPVVDEEAERQAALERRREEQAARDRSLGTVARDSSSETEVVAPYTFNKRSTDKFLGAFGLFVLRLVLAAILAVHGYQAVTDIAATTAQIDRLNLPYSGWFAWGLGIAELLGAVALVFGFLVRVVGLGVLAVSVCSLVFLKWGATNPFRSGQTGFAGEFELLLAGVGLLLFCLGGGGWGIDGGVRRSRARRKAGL